jgi:hypothetical protein
MLFTPLLLLLFTLSCIHAAVISRPHAHENDIYDKPLPAAWYQPADHPAHSLFKRAPGDGTAYPAVGSPGESAYLVRVPPLLAWLNQSILSLVLDFPSWGIYTKRNPPRVDCSPQRCRRSGEDSQHSSVPLSTRCRSQWPSNMFCCRVLQNTRRHLRWSRRNLCLLL